MKTLFALMLLAMPAFAAAAPVGAPAGNPFLSFGMIAVFVVVFYLMVWRPQSKRQKEHKNLLGELKSGDEVVTVSGFLGKVTRIKDEYVVVEIADGVETKVQKHAIANILPKGTLKAI